MIRPIENIDTFTIDKQTVIANLNDTLNDFNYSIVIDGQVVIESQLLPGLAW